MRTATEFYRFIDSVNHTNVKLKGSTVPRRIPGPTDHDTQPRKVFWDILFTPLSRLQTLSGLYPKVHYSNLQSPSTAS